MKKMPTTKMGRAAVKHAIPLLEGRVLSIDPSSGSASSMPGYAIYVAGKLVECGTIEIPYTKKSHVRLRYLKECIEKEFPENWDVLIMESLTIMQSTRRSAMSKLIESVGVILAAVKSDEVIYVAPASWHAYVRRKYGDSYVKSDSEDARVMGELVIATAREWIGEEDGDE